MYDLVRSNEEKLRSGFKILNKFMVILWNSVWPIGLISGLPCLVKLWSLLTKEEKPVTNDYPR